MSLKGATMKCRECKFYKEDIDKDGWGDCTNLLVRGRLGAIYIKYCEEFNISEHFGCIYAERK